MYASVPSSIATEDQAGHLGTVASRVVRYRGMFAVGIVPAVAAAAPARAEIDMVDIDAAIDDGHRGPLPGIAQAQTARGVDQVDIRLGRPFRQGRDDLREL